jgi:hypothetical protein
LEEKTKIDEPGQDLAPDDKILVNLVDKITDDKQEEIAKTICDDYDTDLKSRTEWEEKRNKWYKLWACERDPKSDPWPGCSNICIPMLATAANQFHARAYQAVFAPPGMVKAIPVAENDVKRSKNVQDFLNWQILYEMEEYEDIFDRLLQILPINGIHFKKNYWNPELERPFSEHISSLDLVLPYNTKTLDTARRLVHRLWLYYDELEERQEAGKYRNVDDIDKNTVQTEDDGSLKESGDKAQGMDRPSEDEKPRLVLECHRKWKFNDGTKPYIFTVDYDTQTLMRVASRTFEVGAEKKILNYFTDYHFLPNPQGFYSFGFGHFLENLNEMANTAFNQIFDAGSLTNMPFGFYGRRAGIKKKEIKLRPGLMQEVEDAKQVYFPNMQRVDQVLFMVLGLIQQYTEQFTTVTELISGRQQKGVREPTASGTRDVIQQGLVTFAVMTKRIFRSLRKELRLLMLLNQIHLPDKKEYRVMGDVSKIAFPDIKKEDFDSVKDVIPIGDPSYADRFTLRQEAITLYQLGMSNPFIVGNPQAGIPPQTKVIYHLWEDVVEQFEKKNKSQLVPEMPEESISPEEENAKIMQGEYTEPKSGEDHNMHIRVHSEFEKGPYWASLPEEYKALHVKHGQATMAMKMQDETMMKRLGGQGNG